MFRVSSRHRARKNGFNKKIQHFSCSRGTVSAYDWLMPRPKRIICKLQKLLVGKMGNDPRLWVLLTPGRPRRFSFQFPFILFDTRSVRIFDLTNVVCSYYFVPSWQYCVKSNTQRGRVSQSVRQTINGWRALRILSSGCSPSFARSHWKPHSGAISFRRCPAAVSKHIPRQDSKQHQANLHESIRIPKNK